MPWCRLLLLVSPFLISCAAQATSRAAPPRTNEITPHCEVRARFERATHALEIVKYAGTDQRNAHVGWVFAVDSIKPVLDGTCPQGASFTLAIRGADFRTGDDGAVEYIYPLHVTPLEAGERVAIRIREVAVVDPRNKRSYKEWLITDWTSGIEKL